MNSPQQRHSWSSSINYVLVAAGSTIGFGATWRFPYLVGENGGGAYVLVFIIAMIVIGIPMILVENVIGRRAGKNALDCFSPKFQNKKFSPIWRAVGYIAILGAFCVAAYYMVLGGWVFTYIVNILSGALDLSAELSKDSAHSFFDSNILNNPLSIGIYTTLFVLLNYIVLARGITDGIEKAAKYLMPLLFICLVCIVARNLTLEGAAQGVRFYLQPDFSKITPKLFIDVIGQVFLSLSLGFALMLTLSSYLDKNANMVKTAVGTGILNIVIAVLAGFMIFPSLFTFGMEPDSGPRLVFEVLPIVFSKMAFGSVFAILFFTLLLVAAFTSSVTIYEPSITIVEEKFGLSRKKAVAAVLGVFFVFGNIPCVLAFGVWDEVMIFGRSIFDFFDFISGNVLFVVTALFCAIFVGWVLKDDAKDELSRGFSNKRFINVWFYYVKFIVPLLVGVILFAGLYKEYNA